MGHLNSIKIVCDIDNIIFSTIFFVIISPEVNFHATGYPVTYRPFDFKVKTIAQSLESVNKRITYLVYSM